MTYAEEMQSLWWRWMKLLKPYWWILPVIVTLLLFYGAFKNHQFAEGSFMAAFSGVYIEVMNVIAKNRNKKRANH